MSLSARRAWIEIATIPDRHQRLKSLSARRAWIEMYIRFYKSITVKQSLSARRAWIEISSYSVIAFVTFVALRKESVD